MKLIKYGVIVGAAGLAGFELGQATFIRRERKALIDGWRLGLDESSPSGMSWRKPIVEGEVDKRKLLNSTSALDWTEEFMKVMPDADPGTMLAWFANAIETAKAHEQQRGALEDYLTAGHSD